MLLAGFGGGVEVTHLRDRAFRRIVKRKPLEQRATIHRAWIHCWQAGQHPIVAHDEESPNTTFEIGLRVPRNFIAAATHGRHPNTERRRRRSSVGNGSV